jgi:transposase
MPFTRKRQGLESLRRSRIEEKRVTLHAGILLDLARGESDGAVARINGVNRHTVALCARKFPQFGLEAALGELPRPGKSRRIPDDAIAWVLSCACEKPKAVGYAYELWTYSLLQEHVRKHCVGAGHPSLKELSRSRLHRILTQGEIRPHKMCYYVERRDPAYPPGQKICFPSEPPRSNVTIHTGKLADDLVRCGGAHDQIAIVIPDRQQASYKPDNSAHRLPGSPSLINYLAGARPLPKGHDPSHNA